MSDDYRMKIRAERGIFLPANIGFCKNKSSNQGQHLVHLSEIKIRWLSPTLDNKYWNSPTVPDFPHGTNFPWFSLTLATLIRQSGQIIFQQKMALRKISYLINFKIVLKPITYCGTTLPAWCGSYSLLISSTNWNTINHTFWLLTQPSIVPLSPGIQFSFLSNCSTVSVPGRDVPHDLPEERTLYDLGVFLCCAASMAKFTIIACVENGQL